MVTRRAVDCRQVDTSSTAESDTDTLSGRVYSRAGMTRLLQGLLVCTLLMILIACGGSSTSSPSPPPPPPPPPPPAWSNLLKPTYGASACTLRASGAPAMCAIDWTNAGIPGGIPNNQTQCGATVSASSYGNGSSDASAGIQSALNSCGGSAGNQKYVLLGPGAYRINSAINIPSYTTLRGSGAQQTILSLYNASGMIGGGTWGDYPDTSDTAIVSGATAGSTSVTLASASGVSVGTYLMLTESNDPTFVSSQGNQGSCTWCDEFYSGTRARGQIVEVTALSGKVVGITPALYTDYPNTPWARPVSMTRKYAGIESLQVYSNDTLDGYSGSNLGFFLCAYCWIKGVESNGTSGNNDHVDIYWGYRNEVRDSYFVGCTVHGPGNADCDLLLGEKTSATLIENNIVERTHGAIELDFGAAGNVIAYNYATGQFDAADGAVTMMDFAMHGAHPQFTLVEGNSFAAIYPDTIWGTSSHSTLFRNWGRGSTLICPPTTNGRANVDCSAGSWSTEANRAIQLAGLPSNLGVLYSNMIGNVAGSANTVNDNYAQGTDSCTACLVSPDIRSYSNQGYDFVFGYQGAGDDTGACSSRATCTPYVTSMLHGNYSYAKDAIEVWANGVTHTLPPSFFHSSKPSWWGNTIPWPAIGPDVTGGTGPGGHVYSTTAANPAQACYTSTAKAADGSLAFDSSACY